MSSVITFENIFTLIAMDSARHSMAAKASPPPLHGFRAKHSTMTAWSDIQEKWSESTENKEHTGILLWDLSAAFDTLEHKIFV